MILKKKIYQPPDNSRPEKLAGTPLASFLQRAIALFIDFWTAGITFVLLTLFILFISRLTGLFTFSPDLDIEFTFLSAQTGGQFTIGLQRRSSLPNRERKRNRRKRSPKTRTDIQVILADKYLLDFTRFASLF